jgi:hypothetical protein
VVYSIPVSAYTSIRLYEYPLIRVSAYTSIRRTVRGGVFFLKIEVTQLKIQL